MSSPGPLPSFDSQNRVQTICLMVLATVAITYMVYWLRPVLVPLVVAWFVVSGLRPILAMLERSLGVNRVIAAGITFLAGVVILLGFGLALWASVIDLSENADDYRQRVREIAEEVEDFLPEQWVQSERDFMRPSPAMATDSSGSRGSRLVDSLVRDGIAVLSQALLSLFSAGVIILIYVFFLLIGSPDHSETATLNAIDHQVRAYLVLKTAISFFTGLLFGLVLWAFGVPMAFTFGVLAFLLNFIPNVGPLLATILPLPLVVLQPGATVAWMVTVMGLASAVQTISGNVVEPKLMGNSSDLHPVVVLLALMFWGMIWGVIGMFLATPVTAGIKIMLSRIEATRPIADLMAGRLQGSEQSNSRSSFDPA